MLDRIIKILFLIVIGAMGLLLVVTDIAIAIVQFKWWAFLVIPVGFIVIEIGFIAALILSDWIVYAIRNRTFKGFLNKIQSENYASAIEGYWVENCNACENEYNPKTSGGIVNGHPFCTECLERMGEDSARLEIENERLREELAEFISAKDQKRLIILPQLYESGYGGLKAKYRVFKAKNNEPIDGCFVLRPDKDLASRAALKAYAQATDNLTLWEDIKKWIEALEGGKPGATDN